MHVNIRRAIAFFFILAFFICAPILLLYTSGYRYNFKKAQVQKTGALVIETEPKNATVLLNDKKVDNTPLRLNNVLPDEYNIQVSKDGYYSWEKKLTIKSQETTFAEDLLLFPITSTEKINDYQIKDIFFSNNDRFALFTTQDFEQDYLYLLNLNTRKEKLLYNNNKLFDKTNIVWSNDDSKVFFQLNNGPHVATTVFPQRNIYLNDEIRNMPTDTDNFHWDINNSNIIYTQKGNQVYSINLFTTEAKVIYTLLGNEILLDYMVYQDEIYLIELLNNKPVLTKASLTSELNNNKSIELKHENYTFDSVYGGKIAFNEAPQNTFYLISTDLDRIIFSKDNVTNVNLHPKENLLLLQTNQELSFLNLNSNELVENTITRYSSGLDYATWHHDSTNYNFILQENKIFIVELDERDKRFILELPIDNVTDFRVNSDDEQLIIIKDNHLWELEIEQ